MGLPDEKSLLRYVREAVALNVQGVKRPARASPKKKRELDIPNYFMNALRRNKKEYVEWVTGAKGEKTRQRRLDTAVAWMAEGKVRNWKYIRK